MGINVPSIVDNLEPLEASDELTRLKGQFLNSLNHEIRTPLSGIVGMTDLLLETSLDEQQQEYVAMARICADRLLGLLNDTLEYSALSAGAVRLEESEFNLVETLRAVVADHSPKAEEKGLQLRCILDGAVPEAAIGDAIRLRKLVGCLLGNALKFTRQGQIVMTVGAETTGAGKFLLWVRVHDTGIGIPSEQLGIIFDAFRQIEGGPARSYAGLGLGLSIAQKLVRLMGGEIAAHSEPGKGSLFSASIPLRLPAEAEPASRTLPDSAQPVRRRRVLVAEDDRVSQTVITHHLRRGGYEVRCVGSGEEALAVAGAQRYDLILMDLELPGMNGFDATQGIREIAGYGSTPILALTANYGEPYRTLCREHGMQAYLAKPVKPAELLSTLDRFLG